jgi:hypothetical protein
MKRTPSGQSLGLRSLQRPSPFAAFAFGPDGKIAIALDCSGELRNWNHCLQAAATLAKCSIIATHTPRSQWRSPQAVYAYLFAAMANCRMMA